MSIEKRFIDMLSNNISQIRMALKQKATDKYLELSHDKIYSKESIKLIKRKEELEKELIIVTKELNELQQVVSSSSYTDPKNLISDNAGYVLGKINFESKYTDKNNYNKLFKSEADILESMIDCKEIQSINNFEIIAEQTKNIFFMSSTSKEARNILLMFQSKNWNALGIELPMMNPLGGFDVSENGDITMKTLVSGE